MGIQQIYSTQSKPLVNQGEEKNTWFWVFIFYLYIIQYTAVWIYPPNVFGGATAIIDSKPFAAPYQYFLWIIFFYTLVIYLSKNSLDRIGKNLMPFLFFIISGILSSGFGFNPFYSLKLMITWSAMAMISFIIGEKISSSIEKTMIIAMLSILVPSALFSIFYPPLGTQVYESSVVWRGLFSNKNQFGWISGLFLTTTFALLKKDNLKLSIPLLTIAVVCLYLSGSKGALAASILSFFYMTATSRIAKKSSVGFGALATFLMLLITVTGVFLSSKLALAALGRDVTLTGRTVIWQIYGEAITQSPWIGIGPGAYTSMSVVSAQLANKLSQFGPIFTPHNIFLGTFGDAGLVGLASIIGMLFYFIMYRPISNPSHTSLACGGIAFMIATHGLVETHEVYTTGAGWFLLMTLHAGTQIKNTHPESIK